MAYFSLIFHATALLLWLPTLAGNNTDHLALLAIKSSITHNPQHVLNTWNTSLHFCQWQGVTCGRRHPRVTELDLKSSAIVGSLSPHIGNLSFLRVIILSNNTFTGVIPPQLGSLFRLQKLILANNSFTGEVPATLSNCTRLTVLSLARNKLTGNLPKQLASLINLIAISLYKNHFTGGIPSFLGNFSFLETILAGGNHLDGIIPSSLGQLQNLKVIIFSINQLHGIIPRSIYNLSSLLILDFSGNRINEELPSDIGLMLPNLQIFQVISNKFTGNIPVTFSNCSNLVNLILAINGFSGKVGVDFSRIPNLRVLELSSNSLGSWESDEMNFIDSMVNCSKLEVLQVYGNRLRGVLPDSVSNLSSELNWVSFGQNFLYGSLPSGIGNLVKLEILSLQNNQFTGVIPSEIGNLQNLKELYLGGNFIGKFPDFIGNLSLLNELYLSVNRLEGEISLNLGNCTSLVSLDISGNNLTGPIPVELFKLSSLSKILNLAQNHLSGSIPQEIGKLKSLTNLDLSQNDLTGAIPDAIGSCMSLEYLDLKENSFQGPIPPIMKDLRGISYLDLSSNKFSGKIPKFLEQLNLSSLNLSFNNLDGEVPIRGIFKNASAFAVNGNNRLCGGIPELRLPKCDNVERSKKGSTRSRVILIVIPICSFLVVAMALFLLFCWQRRKRQLNPTEKSILQPFSRVSYGSILKATDQFSEQNLIGTGYFSVVYKGILEPFGVMGAIKVLKLEHQGALKSFMAECEALKNIRHRNLVKIITVCSSIDFQGNDFKALIYEFMPNGNLESWLYPNPEPENNLTPRRLNLQERLRIAIDVANGIHYLHQDCEVPIIHCDLKPSNVLLDDDMVAQIGDFGLAKFLPLKPHESSSIAVRGTVGYAAPEYGLGNEMRKEGDIYSFGILLLEMMTGKRPTHSIFEQGLNLHGYVMMALRDRVMEIIESSLLCDHEEQMENANVHRDYSHDVARRRKKSEEGIISLARLGLACSMESPSQRMQISEISHELRRISGILGIN